MNLECHYDTPSLIKGELLTPCLLLNFLNKVQCPDHLLLLPNFWGFEFKNWWSDKGSMHLTKDKGRYIVLCLSLSKLQNCCVFTTYFNFWKYFVPSWGTSFFFVPSSFVTQSDTELPSTTRNPNLPVRVPVLWLPSDCVSILETPRCRSPHYFVLCESNRQSQNGESPYLSSERGESRMGVERESIQTPTISQTHSGCQGSVFRLHKYLPS